MHFFNSNKMFVFGLFNFFFPKVKQKIVDGRDFQLGYRNSVQNLEGRNIRHTQRKERTEINY